MEFDEVKKLLKKNDVHIKYEKTDMTIRDKSLQNYIESENYVFAKVNDFTSHQTWKTRVWDEYSSLYLLRKDGSKNICVENGFLKSYTFSMDEDIDVKDIQEDQNIVTIEYQKYSKVKKESYEFDGVSLNKLE